MIQKSNAVKKTVATPPAAPRHMNQLLPLLPSGPGGVHNLSLRGDRQELPYKMIPQESGIASIDPIFISALPFNKIYQGRLSEISLASWRPPTAIVMYCLPSIIYVIGVPCGARGSSYS